MNMLGILRCADQAGALRMAHIFCHSERENQGFSTEESLSKLFEIQAIYTKLVKS